jgi:hypothetical protein
MSTLKEKQEALRRVADAAKIHGDNLRASLKDRYNTEPFNAARADYVSKLNGALVEVSLLKLDESLKVSERVRDLGLEESVDLLHAVEDHIRSLRRNSRIDFA